MRPLLSFCVKGGGILNGGLIASVHPRSLAEELGLVRKDKILTVNGRKIQDLIDFSFAFADEEIEMLVEHENGEWEVFEFDKDCDEKLGVEFDSAVFDGIRRCHNRCWFCFVDQLPPHMRASLSVKDDDYRMSFLYGNFITMTNMKEEDFQRIEKLHLTPLYVSVHTTNGGLRAKMLRNKTAEDILEKLERLKQASVQVHTQIVLCPGVNDGKELERTLRDLTELRPVVRSVAIVPVGLTKYREKCYPLQMFTKEQAQSLIRSVERLQGQSRKTYGDSFIYLGDEFYFLAGYEVPAASFYDSFPQLANGIGLTRSFLDEWESEPVAAHDYKRKLRFAVACGRSAAKLFEQITAPLQDERLEIRVLAIENRHFGENITVSGLLTGADILAAAVADTYDGLIFPGSSLRDGEAVFLDDMTVDELQRKLCAPVRAVYHGGELKRALLHWTSEVYIAGDSVQYTWQSNCAYNKNR